MPTPATVDTLDAASAFMAKIAGADVRGAVRQFDMPDLEVLATLEARCFVHQQEGHSVLVWTELPATEQGKPPIVFVDQVGITRNARQRYTHGSGYDYGVLGLLLAALTRHVGQVFASPPPWVYLVCARPIAWKYGLYGFRLAKADEHGALHAAGMEVNPSEGEVVMVLAPAA